MKMFKEEVAANSVSSGGVDMNPNGINRKYRKFDVSSEVFRRFREGRNKYERWAKFLDSNDEDHKSIKKYATRNPKSVIVLRDSTTGALKAIRRRCANGL